VLIPLRDHNPRSRVPIVTLLIIAANVVVFLLELLRDPLQQQALVAAAGAIPYEIVHRVDLGQPNLVPWPGTIWTSMFLHGGFGHLIGNMWFLWLFGDNVEEAMGPGRYAFFYLFGGTVGAVAQILAMPESTTPMIGASGCVAAALGAYVMLYPHARVSTLIMIPLLWPVVQVRAWIFLGLWFVLQFLLPNAGVAWMAHVGGFLAGLGLARLLAKRRQPPPRGPVDVEYLPPTRRRW
jgi:membrane associated rhomboid family serine protease